MKKLTAICYFMLLFCRISAQDGYLKGSKNESDDVLLSLTLAAGIFLTMLFCVNEKLFHDPAFSAIALPATKPLVHAC